MEIRQSGDCAATKYIFERHSREIAQNVLTNGLGLVSEAEALSGMRRGAVSSDPSCDSLEHPLDRPVRKWTGKDLRPISRSELALRSLRQICGHLYHRCATVAPMSFGTTERG